MENQGGENKKRNNKLDFHELIHFIFDLMGPLYIFHILLSYIYIYICLLTYTYISLLWIYVHINIYIYIHAYFKKLWKNNVSRLVISQHPVRIPNTVRVPEALYGTWWCDLPREVLGKISNYLKIFKAWK